MKEFDSTADLIRYAKEFVGARIRSLLKDVAHCINEPYAPYPAISYCFSTIDLLGALAAGNARSGAPTTEQSATYMKRFMGYSDEQTKLLQKVFRHKVVHLAVPNPVVTYEGRVISWHYEHDDLDNHLTVKPFCGYAQAPTERIQITHEFTLGIKQLADDVRRSVEMDGGYLDSLRSDQGLQKKFEAALGHMYDPSQSRRQTSRLLLPTSPQINAVCLVAGAIRAWPGECFTSCLARTPGHGGVRAFVPPGIESRQSRHRLA